MARIRYHCFYDENGKFCCVKAEPAKATASSPYIIEDTMDNTWHPVTGKHSNSKSTFRRMTRESGAYEMGNDRIPRQKPDFGNLKQDIVESMKELKML